MIWVVKADKAAGKYCIRIEFSDGTVGIVDFEKILKKDHREIIRELLNTDLFNRFFIDNDTINWKNGADFAPEFLYEIMSKVQQAA
ncbi:MAG: DUF2442 domain-containing protein [Bacteroidales bacterium]|jgi:hypothetical protein|nr:DUF2442 domain-containing protein [Bacteroidales bacterium]